MAKKRKRFLSFQSEYRAKTRPQQIASSAGGRGGQFIFVKKVHHPGTEARDFDEIIARKWQREYPRILERAIDEALP